MNEKKYFKIGIGEQEVPDTERTYNTILENLKELSKQTDIELIREAIYKLVDRIIEKLSSKDESLLLCTGRVHEKDYILAHSLDVCLLSIKIGMRIEIKKERLKELGYLALIHARKDIGFPGELSRGVKRDSEMEEIIKLADIYDALTHPPVYRHKMIPKETLESIIGSKNFFDRRFIKILLEEVSLYPVGSWIQLTTKEIGKVIKIAKGHLMRPTVEIHVNWEGMRLKEPKIIDLTQKHLIQVLRPLSEEEIKVIKRL